MSKVVIYTASLCPYCHMAKSVFETRGLAFEEIDVTGQPALRSEMVEKAGGRMTVPQIWIGSEHVGGCDDLLALERSGNLDQILENAL